MDLIDYFKRNLEQLMVTLKANSPEEYQNKVKADIKLILHLYNYT